jgi:hypothetical protein
MPAKDISQNDSFSKTRNTLSTVADCGIMPASSAMMEMLIESGRVSEIKKTSIPDTPIIMPGAVEMAAMHSTIAAGSSW